MGFLKKRARMNDDLKSVLMSVILMDIFKVKPLMNWFSELGSEMWTDFFAGLSYRSQQNYVMKL